MLLFVLGIGLFCLNPRTLLSVGAAKCPSPPIFSFGFATRGGGLFRFPEVSGTPSEEAAALAVAALLSSSPSAEIDPGPAELFGACTNGMAAAVGTRSYAGGLVPPDLADFDPGAPVPPVATMRTLGRDMKKCSGPSPPPPPHFAQIRGRGPARLPHNLYLHGHARQTRARAGLRAVLDRRKRPPSKKIAHASRAGAQATKSLGLQLGSGVRLGSNRSESFRPIRAAFYSTKRLFKTSACCLLVVAVGS